MFTSRRKKGLALEYVVTAVLAVCFWVAEGTLAPAPSFTDCHGTIYLLQ